jgi:phosphate uptake regulator
METRNLQKTGGSSYTITLPKEWIKKLKLSEKDRVEIVNLKKDLLGIKPVNSQKTTSFTIFIGTKTDKQLTREIIAIYLTGINEILIYANPMSYEQRKLIRSISYRLIGFELFDATTNNMVLKNVSSNVIPTSEYVSKMNKIMLSMYEDMQKARDVIERDIEVDRIQLMISRKFKTILYSMHEADDTENSLSQAHFYEHIAIRIERIADHIVKAAYTIFNMSDNSTISLNKPEKDSLNKIHKYLEVMAEIVSDFNKNKIDEIFEFCDQFPKEIFNNNNVNKPAFNIILDDSLGRIKSYLKNIAEEALNYFAAKKIEPLLD